jgi:hypothetical protein
MQFMLTSVGGIGTTLGLTVANFQEAVNSTLLEYGVTAIAEATDIAQLRALALVQAWRTARAAASAWYDFSADNAEFKRSQVLTAINAALDNAETAALAYTVQYTVLVGTMTYAADPYVFGVDDVDTE